MTPLDVLAWLSEHPTITLGLCVWLIAQALIVAVVQGGALADRAELGERRAVQR